MFVALMKMRPLDCAPDPKQLSSSTLSCRLTFLACNTAAGLFGREATEIVDTNAYSELDDARQFCLLAQTTQRACALW
jgi:hypothetical protein